jgi:hypothetical protein
MVKPLTYIGLALAVLFVFSCKKETDEPVAPIPEDYRAKWVGEYEVAVKCYSWILGGEYTSTESTDTISVAIVEGSVDSLAINGSMHIPIDSSGTYFNSPFPSNYYSLSLWNDSISIHWNSGGLGGGNGCTYTGFKLD